MKFEINNMHWVIKEVEQKEFWDDDNKTQTENDGTFFGRTLYGRQEIWIDKDINKAQKRRTLMHELMHCYKGSYITFSDLTLDDELLCDISANSHDIIHKIVDDYFKEAK